MEVKAGYKQTDVGVIPEKWEVVRLQEVTNIKTGPFGSSLHEKDYVRDGTPIITVEHLSEHGVVHSNLPMVSDIDKQRLKSYALEENDIVFSRVGSVDRNSLIGQKEAGWLFSGRLLRVRPNGKRVSSKYLNYQFQSEPFIQRVMCVAVGQTMPSLNTQILNSINVALPSTPEQYAIASTLSDVDALITALDRLIAKKHNIKQATMQELLTGKKRLPGFVNGNKYKQTEVGVIPKDWTLVELRTLIDKTRSIRYGIVQPGDYDPSGRLMVRGQDYSKGWVNKTQMFRVSSQIEERYKNARLRPGDLIITIVGAGTGHVEVIPDWLDGANLTQTTARISIDSKKANNHFCKYYLQSSGGNIQVANFIKGGAQPGLNCCDVEKFLISLPADPQEQDAIATVLSGMDAEVAALKARREKTRILKQGMMQELLTGHIRLMFGGSV